MAGCGNAAAQGTVPGSCGGQSFTDQLAPAWPAKALLVSYWGDECPNI